MKLNIDFIYPVGSIYMSVNATNPSTLFGGTWEQLKDRFLLGAGSTYTNGTTGGEKTHTLTVEEMPYHTHGLTQTYNVPSGSGNGGIALSQWTATSGTTSPTGNGKSHNNMPPYLVVYMWKRIA